jgi:hypothetical protein
VRASSTIFAKNNFHWSLATSVFASTARSAASFMEQFAGWPSRFLGRLLTFKWLDPSGRANQSVVPSRNVAGNPMSNNYTSPKDCGLTLNESNRVDDRLRVDHY